MKRKNSKLISTPPSDLLIDLLRSYIGYIALIGGVWLVMELISLLVNPEKGFNSLFNQKEAFINSAVIFTVLIIRQQIAEFLAARINVIVSEIAALLVATGLFILLFDIKLNGIDVAGSIIIVIVRYVIIQDYWDSALLRKRASIYSEFSKIRRINFLPAFMSLTIFMEYAIYAYPILSRGFVLGIMAELIVAISTTQIINNIAKTKRIPTENFSSANRIVVDIDAAELYEKAFLHKKEIVDGKKEIKNMFNQHGYGFSGNTLILNLDTLIFCRKQLPETENKSVLIHLRKSAEKYGTITTKQLKSIADGFISAGYIVFFQYHTDVKSNAQIDFENELAKTCIILNKGYAASLETVLNGGEEYNQNCVEHIREHFSTIFANTSNSTGLCAVVNTQLRELISEYSLLDMFYELLQTVELCTHLTCLCALSKGGKADKKSVEQLALGDMVNITRRFTPNKKITDDNIKESVKFIETLCNLKTGGSVNEHRLFHCIVCLRNRYLGHGTMTYSVSEELVLHLTTVSALITEICCQLLTGEFSDVDLKSTDIPFTKAKAALLIDNQMYFYSSFIYDDKAEYINPLNGQIYQNCKRRIISTCMNDGKKLKGDDAR